MITVYTAPDCGYCNMAKVYLSSRNINYIEKDISKDPVAADWVAGAVGQLATPVLDIEGTIVLGFKPTHIDQALKQKNII